MSIDDLIPILIFIGIILFNVFKSAAKKKAKPKSAQPQKKPKKKKTSGLSMLVDTIKTEIEKASVEARQNKQGQGDSIWDALAGKVEKENTSLTELPAETDREKVVSPEPEPIEIPGLEPAPEFFDEPAKEEDGFVPRKEAIQGVPDLLKVTKRKHRRALRLSASKMREAIVLSEILAKPVGMRD